MRTCLTALGLLAPLIGSMAMSDSNCKCFPGETCWPSIDQWDALNVTVDGRLIATVPLARSCHVPYFNITICSTLRSEWLESPVHVSDPSSVTAPFFANQSCDPFTSPDDPCRYGNYVRYAVNVSSADDVIATIAFAREHDIRFVVRNTGHDYLGRSTGAGALAVWTHHLKGIEFLDWSDPAADYTGKAVRLGAGVQGSDILAAAHDEGLVVVTGECPSVGIAGGYTQGGGHSALATSFGLSADNTLEWEVVTADGELLTASPSENSDLYWALSGGGGGTYAVVLSMTVKAHPDAYVTGAELTFSAAGSGISNDTFDGAVDAFHTALPAMVDAGSLVLYFVSPGLTFSMAPLTAFNKTQDEAKAILAPYLDTLTALNITYDVTYTHTSTYYEYYLTHFGPIPEGFVQVGVAQYGSRLVPLSTFEDNLTEFGQTVRFILDHGVNATFIATDVSPFGGDDFEKNAILPAWRAGGGPVALAIFTTPWSFIPEEWSRMLEYQKLMTDTIMPAIEAITPGSGAYMNEADFLQPNFQTVFFGSKYDRLLDIKKRYDPDDFFYVATGVGSEAWKIEEDGHMCRT